MATTRKTAKQADPFTIRRGARRRGDLLIGTARIALVEQDDADYHGWHTTIPEHQIVFRPGPAAYQAGIILHESLHAMSHLYGLNLSEATTRCLEQGISCLLQQNPELARNLCRPPRKSGRKV